MEEIFLYLYYATILPSAILFGFYYKKLNRELKYIGWMVISWILYQYFVYTLAYTTIGYILFSCTNITDTIFLGFIFYPYLKQVKLDWLIYPSVLLVIAFVFIDYININTPFDTFPHHTRLVTFTFTIISCLVFFYIFTFKERTYKLFSNPMLIFCSTYLIFSSGCYVQYLFWLDILNNNIDFNIGLYLVLLLNLGMLLTFTSAIFSKPTKSNTKRKLSF